VFILILLQVWSPNKAPTVIIPSDGHKDVTGLCETLLEEEEDIVVNQLNFNGLYTFEIKHHESFIKSTFKPQI